MNASGTLIAVENLRKEFVTKTGFLGGAREVLKAVNDISFAVRRGETLGLVGESGSGKSTVGRMLAQLLTPTGGTIRYEGTDIAALSGPEIRAFRLNVQMIFQDPYSSLNPRMTTGETVSEPLRVHGLTEKGKERERAQELLSRVGLGSHAFARYPHEFSGGQRQRIGIARALAMNPKLIICDEPVSALDVSIQSQILNLLMDLQDQQSLSYLFIAHDLSVVKHVSDRIAVMYLGRIVEMAPRRALFDSPAHPYTRALLSAIPSMDGNGREKRQTLKGEVPSPINPPSGCHFRNRCPQAIDACAVDRPPLEEVGPDHFSACIRN